MDKINDIIVWFWMFRVSDWKLMFVFCVDLVYVFELICKFCFYGFDVRFVMGDMFKNERSVIFDVFRVGEFFVFVNCSVFIEGIDIFNVDCIIFV